MEVNLNNLRKKTCYAYDRLARKLNNSIEENMVTIDCYDIQSEMGSLKQLIGEYCFRIECGYLQAFILTLLILEMFIETLFNSKN